MKTYKDYKLYKRLCFIQLIIGIIYVFKLLEIIHRQEVLKPIFISVSENVFGTGINGDHTVFLMRKYN